MNHPLSRPATALTILALLPVAVQIFVAVHESGHALAALALGARIREFHISVLAGRPHTSYTGLKDGARALVTVAGPGLPLLSWVAWLLAVRRDRSAWQLKLLFVGGVGAFFPLLLWAVLPVLSAGGVRVHDDSVSFVRLAGVSPYLVSGTALAVLAGCLWVYARRVTLSGTIRARLTPIVSPRFHLILCSIVVLAALYAIIASR